MTDAERALLYSIRNIVDALLLSVEAPGVEPATCPHDQREPAPTSTLGNEQWWCARCHAPLEP